MNLLLTPAFSIAPYLDHPRDLGGLWVLAAFIIAFVVGYLIGKLSDDKAWGIHQEEDKLGRAVGREPSEAGMREPRELL